MRIIAGTHRRRLLHPPRGRDVTRPITDRAKQRLFDRLANQGLLEGGHVIDAFAGTGSLGIEALSRGVDHATFVERDRQSGSLLRRNLDELGLADRATVLAVDALQPGWLALAPSREQSVIFCDPPYRLCEQPEDRPRVARLLTAFADVAAPWAMLILRTRARVEPLDAAPWVYAGVTEVGSMAIHAWDRTAQAPPPAEADTDPTAST